MWGFLNPIAALRSNSSHRPDIGNVSEHRDECMEICKILKNKDITSDSKLKFLSKVKPEFLNNNVISAAKELMVNAIREDSRQIRFAPDVLAGDGEFIKFLCKKLNGNSFKLKDRLGLLYNMRPVLYNDKDVISAASNLMINTIKKYPQEIKNAPDILARDDEFIKGLCAILKDNNIKPEYKKGLVFNMGSAFLSNKDVISIARELVITDIRVHRQNTAFIPYILARDDEFIKGLCAILNDSNIKPEYKKNLVRNMRPEFLAHKDLMIAAISENPENIKYAPDSLAKDGNFVGFLCKKLTNENITSEERRKFVRNMQPAFLSNEKVMSAVLGRDDQSGRSCWDAVSGSVFENLFYLGNIYDLKGRSNKDTSINTGSGNGFVKTSDGVGFYFKDIGAKSTECNVEVCGLLQYEALHESLSQEESDIPSNNGEPSFSFVKNAREIIKESKDIDRFYEVIHRYDTINITSDSWGNYDALKLVKKALGEGKKVEWTIGSVANERFLYPSSYCLGRSFTKQLEGLFADKSYNKEKLSVAVSGEHKYNFFHPSKDMDVVPKLVEKFNLREEEPSANPLNPNSNGKKKPDNRQC